MLTPGDGGRRRRMGALTALVVGLFLGLTLLPVKVTGPVGGYIGHALWQLLGAGALGIPLLGIGLALAGFDRLGGLDMKRSAILIVGLSVLVPYVVAVLTDVSPADLDADVGQRGFAARMVGLVPGFLAEAISGKVGVAGAVLLGFLALSALTLVTFAWHPLQRLEAGGQAVGRSGGQRDGGTGGTERRRERATPGERRSKERKPKEEPRRRLSRRRRPWPAGEHRAVRRPPSRRPARRRQSPPAAAAPKSPTPRRWSCSRRRWGRTSTRARRSSTGSVNRCWRLCGPSRSKGRSRGGPPGRW